LDFYYISKSLSYLYTVLLIHDFVKDYKTISPMNPESKK